MKFKIWLPKWVCRLILPKSVYDQAANHGQAFRSVDGIAGSASVHIIDKNPDR